MPARLKSSQTEPGFYAFRDGASPETIRESFPSLNLAQVYGALAYYLNHPEECEQYLAALDGQWNETDGVSNALRVEQHCRITCGSMSNADLNVALSPECKG